MKRFFILLAIISLGALSLTAQTPTPAPATKEIPEVTANWAIGTVVAVDATNKQIVLSTKSAGAFIIGLAEATKFVKVAPDAKTLEGATPIALTDIGAGDRIWVRGVVSGNNIPAAKQVILMNKAEIAKKNDTERMDWVRRGIVGKVVNVNAGDKEITLSIQRAGQPQNIILPIAPDSVKFRRYNEDAIKFADAKPSSFAEVKVGDQMRALGVRNEAGTHYTPEQIVFGTFRTITGTIVSIDAAKNEVVILDEKKQLLTLTLKPDSSLKRIDFSAMMGGMGGGGFGGGRPGGGQPGAGGQPPSGGQPAAGGPPPNGGQPGTGGAPNGGQPGGGQGRGEGRGEGQGGGQRRVGGGGFDIQAIIDRMPETTLAELKAGETIVVAGTKNADPKKLTAITLLSNVEPLIQMMARMGGGGAAGAAGGAGAGAGGFGGGGLDLGLGLP